MMPRRVMERAIGLPLRHARPHSTAPMNTLLGQRSSLTRRAFLHRTALGLGAATLLRERTFAAAAPAGLRVFVTAHSFHNFVAQRLGTLAKAAGIEGHQLVGQQMIGGSKTIQHW